MSRISEGMFDIKHVRGELSRRALDPVPLKDRPTVGAKDGTKRIVVENYSWGRVGFARDPSRDRAWTWVQLHGEDSGSLGLPEWAVTLLRNLRE